MCLRNRSLCLGPGNRLTIGVGGGNVINTIGPVTGTLMAGRQYQYTFELAADCNQFSPETGMATGGVTLTFAGATLLTT